MQALDFILAFYRHAGDINNEAILGYRTPCTLAYYRALARA